MIPNRNIKSQNIIQTIHTRIKEINERYRKGPSLYFYQRIIILRKICGSLQTFLSDDNALAILYATLVSWDMDSRGARMKYFDDFKSSIISATGALLQLEECKLNFSANSSGQLLDCLKQAYSGLNLMETKARLVSNSKCLHFLFPTICIPMDGTNTLKYLYGNTGESLGKYAEIAKFAFEIIDSLGDCSSYLDDKWNPNVPKMIDNAIIILVNQSLSK